MTPWLQTASGRRFDLCDPTPEMVDFEVDVPEALARIPRFTGHVRAGPYSVAQHCILGADAILRETGNREAALAFLLHDAHEAYIGDIATPIGVALAETAARGFTLASGVDIGFVVRSSLKALKRRIDRAIFGAAGLTWPLPERIATIVSDYDIRMLRTERDTFLWPTPERWDVPIEICAPIARIRPIVPWTWQDAAAAWRAAFEDGMSGFPAALARHPRERMEA